VIEASRIKAILFDSGHVLNRPKTGHWFIPPNFFKYVNKEVFNTITDETLDIAFRKGMDYLESKKFVVNEEEEFEHFCHFYRLSLLELPGIGLGEYEIKKIAEDAVLNDEKFFFFEDVFEVIPRLRQKYALGVVSDTWPSLDRVFKNVGLRKYFSTFVMSSILGVLKPHELMFDTALMELGLKAEEALFIDDNIKNLEGAKTLGMQTLLMIREENLNKSHSEYEYIISLNSLEQLLNVSQ
jgi:putative hydrolase of the HAD superfamily